MSGIERAALDTRIADFGTQLTGNGPVNAPSQVTPAASASSLIAAELANLDQEQLTEAEEGAALNLGTRLRGTLSPRRPDSSVARGVLAKMKATLGDEQRARVEALVEQFDAIGDDEAPLGTLRDAGLSDGTIALVLASLHARANGGRRKRLSDAMEALLAEETDWAMELFGLLELGPHTAGTAAELKQLYQRASDGMTGLSRWLGELKKARDRHAKIKALLRVLGLELSDSGAGTSDERLGATVMDLKRLLIFLGIEEQCEYIAQSLDTAGVDGERMLSSVLSMVDETFLYPDWIRDEARTLGLSPERAVTYCQHMLQVVKMLPMPCFNEADQRSQMIDTLLQVAEQYETE
ncbi:type III secretion system TyeA family effector delivery regulator [Paraburkholderia graminis]|uniref:Type III secretion system TyeA family effector delivery regulator n=1 Tax=Paraburkholderia graminis TaxID=60548 RepID=A0ABD5C7T5_9BURK|nr:type III secretion system TyeA family effector delivery regulator [Paraburkholderia graminis]